MPVSHLYLIFYILYFSFISCSSDDSENSGAAIGFTSYMAQTTTRAGAEVKKEIPVGESIGVYAYYHDGVDTDADGIADVNGAWSDAATPNFMYNQPCTNEGADAALVYAPLKYWPNEQHDKISFIAYYPYTDVLASAEHPESPTQTGVTPLLANDGTGMPTFQFVVNDDVTRQTDFLVSDLMPNLPNGTQAVWPSSAGDRAGLTIADRVRFYFRHALAKVTLRIVVHPDIRPHFSKLKLNKLTFTHIKNTGTLTPEYDPSTGTTFTWDSQGTTTGEAGAHTYVVVDGEHSVNHIQESYLLMPQNLVNDARLTLDYELTLKGYNTVYTYDAYGNPVLQDVYTYKNPDASVQLNKMKASSTGAYITSWQANTHYVYTIRLNANAIEYTGQVADWGDTQEVNDIVVEE